MKYVAFDIETTGLDKTKDHIIQFAAVKFEFNLIDEIQDMQMIIAAEYRNIAKRAKKAAKNNDAKVIFIAFQLPRISMANTKKP